jgi:hypothetical protein
MLLLYCLFHNLKLAVFDPDLLPNHCVIQKSIIVHILAHLFQLLQDLFGTCSAVSPLIMNDIISGIMTDVHSNCNAIIAVSLVIPDMLSDQFLNLYTC